MPWQVTIDGKSMLLDELTEDEFVEAASYGEDLTWLRLYVAPASHPKAFYRLLQICAMKMKVDSPPRPTNVKQAAELIPAHIKQVDDDLPSEFDEGGLPLGEADAKVTPTSSTSTAPVVGLRK
jgi:hypothetical protein